MHAYAGPATDAPNGTPEACLVLGNQ